MNARWYAMGAVVLVGVMTASCGSEGDDTNNDNSDDSVCAGVNCSGHGTCVDIGGSPACDCDSDYHAVGLTCVADTPSFAGSCTVASAEACIDFTGSVYTAQAVQLSCTGAYSADYCTATNRLGRCASLPGAGTGTEHVTSYYTGDASFWQSSCETLGGTWTAG